MACVFLTCFFFVVHAIKVSVLALIPLFGEREGASDYAPAGGDVRQGPEELARAERLG